MGTNRQGEKTEEPQPEKWKEETLDVGAIPGNSKQSQLQRTLKVVNWGTAFRALGPALPISPAGAEPPQQMTEG